MAKIAVIEFGDYPDEWVRVRLGVPMRDYEAIVDAAEACLRRFLPEELRALRAAVLPVIDSWSYPEPVDADGLAERDPNWLLAVVREWATAVRRVPLPLPARSSDGAPSEDQTADSPSPEPSPEPNSTTTS